MARAYSFTNPEGRLLWLSSRSAAEAARRSSGGGEIEQHDLPSSLGDWLQWLNDRAAAPAARPAEPLPPFVSSGKIAVPNPEKAIAEADAASREGRDRIIDAEIVELQKRVIAKLQAEIDQLRADRAA
jgi:hypothetical protein